MSKKLPDLEEIQKKLLHFETSLQRLLADMDEQRLLAQRIQKTLMPNRFPKIPGLKCHSRFVSAKKLGVDTFDLIPTKEGREIWGVLCWSDSYSLSSLLLQTLIVLQSQALVKSHPDTSVEQFFNDIVTQFADNPKNSHYRLHVFKLDLSSLQIQGLSSGMPLPLYRKFESQRYGSFEFVAKGEGLGAPNSAAPVLADKAFHYVHQLRAGQRFFVLNQSWAPKSKDQESLASLIKLADIQQSHPDLLEDLNAILKNIESLFQSGGADADIVALAFEIDSKHLHLA